MTATNERCPLDLARTVLAIAGNEERIEVDLARALLAAEAERDRMRARAVTWQPVETMPPTGVFLVYLAEPMLGSRVHACRRHPAGTTVGTLFDCDAPPITHWAPLPEAPDDATPATREEAGRG